MQSMKYEIDFYPLSHGKITGYFSNYSLKLNWDICVEVLTV